MGKQKRCNDHLGNEFNSITEMCDHYGIPREVYKSRIQYGWNLENALTSPIHENVYDHLGNEFNSYKEMFEFYGISLTCGNSRKRMGWSIEKILTTPVNKIDITCADHNGNVFKNKTKMCKHYGISLDTYNKRISSGSSIQDALQPYNHRPPKSVFDHLGNEFSSITEMCKYHKIDKMTYSCRRRLGWSLEKSLTEPKYRQGKYTDCLDGEILTIAQIIKKYNLPISYSYLKNRLCRGNYTFSQAIGISIMIRSCKIYNINETKYNLTVVKRIKKGKDVFECYIDNGDGTSTFKIMSYEMIDQYCIEQYKKLNNIK